MHRERLYFQPQSTSMEIELKQLVRARLANTEAENLGLARNYGTPAHKSIMYILYRGKYFETSLAQINV